MNTPTKIQQAIWKPLKSYDLYEFTMPFNVKRKDSNKILSQYIGSTGYYMITIKKDGKYKPQRVHRLIAKEFIPNPYNKPNVNHIDGNKLNNSIDNLEWCTTMENNRHAIKLGLNNNRGINNGMSKLNPQKVREIRLLLRDGNSQYKIANIYNVSRSAIMNIHNGRDWKHVI